jgi:hypothetical protein
LAAALLANFTVESKLSKNDIDMNKEAAMEMSTKKKMEITILFNLIFDLMKRLLITINIRNVKNMTKPMNIVLM